MSAPLDPRHRARVWWALWLGVTIAVVRPWHGYVGHSHWAQVEWIPFSHRPVSILDVISNVILFVPLGALQATAFPAASPTRTVWTVAVATLLLSTAFELCQVYSHTRLPSATDVAANVCGAVCGAALFRRGRGPSILR